MIDVSDIVSDPDFTRTIVLRRPAAPTFGNEGVVSYGYATDVPITAVVQPAKPSDLAVLPEGTDLIEVIAVWTTTRLIAGDESGTGSDILVDGGKTYRIVKLNDWSANGYYGAWAQRFEAPP